MPSGFSAAAGASADEGETASGTFADEDEAQAGAFAAEPFSGEDVNDAGEAGAGLAGLQAAIPRRALMVLEGSA